ncbi:hypothetical protein GGH99_004918, partial [Coemansia sp. RSA 1285]
MLRIHEESFSTSDLVLNPIFFPGICVGDVVTIRPLVDSDSSGDMTSPRITLDSSSASVTHSSDSVSTSKAKGALQTSLKNGSNSSMTGTGAKDTGETGTESISGSSRDGESSYRASHRKHLDNEHRPSLLTRASKASAPAPAPTPAPASTATATATAAGDFGRRTFVGDPNRLSRPQAPIVPKGPHRWKGVSESDVAGSMDKSRPTKQKSTTTTTTKDNSDKDGDEANLQPDPRREILLQVGEVRKDTQQIQASMSNFVARTMWGEYLTNQRVAIRKIDMHNSEERESIRADF